MAVPANTGRTVDYTTIREDLSDVARLLSPTETPILSMVGTGEKFTQKLKEWSTVALAAANEDNAAIEGDDVSNDAPTVAVRLANYTQLMDKVAGVTSTNEASDAAGKVNSMKKQILYKVKELKLDQEKRLLCAKPAVPGDASATAGKTAGTLSFIRTNVSRGTGGANPTLSGTTTGYPNAAPTNGTQRAFTEALLKAVLQSIWEQGGNSKIIVTGGFNKQAFSAFDGNAQKTKEVDDKKIVAAASVYEGDFGKLTCIPARNASPRDALILDPDHVKIGYLQKMRNEPLAKTGHSDRRMVSVEWGTILTAENAHGVVADLTTS